MLQIKALTSSGNDGNVETNVIDGNLATRWSCNGLGSWIQADLGGAFTITEVDIAWYKGDTGRVSNFQITTSTDNLSFQPVLTAQSSGKTASLEKYPLASPPPVARYVRITVDSNSQNNWASITELEIFGGGSPTPPPPVPIPPPGTRQQVRQTTTAGDPVADANWTIVSDTGALPVIQGPGIMTVQDQKFSVLENTPLNFELTTTDTNTGVTILFDTSIPANGKITQGTAPVAANAVSLVYTPNQGFAGTDTFTYSASDNKGAKSNTATVTITVSGTPPPPLQVDNFGIKMVYATDTNGVTTYMDMDDPTKTPGAGPGMNPEGSGSYYPNFKKNSDGSWNISKTEIRWAWNATQGAYPGDDNICKCYSTDAKQGYMASPKDWKNIEMTAYYRINSASTSTSNGEGHIEHVHRGQRSTTSTTASGPGGCMIGCSGNLHGNTYFNALKGLASGPARQKWEKDYFHSAGYGQDLSGVNNNSAYNFQKGQWIGIKTVTYNNPDGTVTLEHWTDESNTNTWKKTHSYKDAGQWVPKSSTNIANGCKWSEPNQPFTFGGPLSVFRSDNLTSYDIKNASIRSIDSSKPLQAKEEHERKLDVNDGPTETDEIYQNSTVEEEKEEDKVGKKDDKEVKKASESDRPTTYNYVQKPITGERLNNVAECLDTIENVVAEKKSITKEEQEEIDHAKEAERVKKEAELVAQLARDPSVKKDAKEVAKKADKLLSEDKEETSGGIPIASGDKAGKFVD